MADINKRVKLIGGITEDGMVVPLRVDEDGNLSGVGGGGGATQAQIQAAIEAASNLNLLLDAVEADGGQSNLRTVILGTVTVTLNELPPNSPTSLNQTTIIENLGSPTEASATSDTGNFSLIRLIKRLLSVKLPDAIEGRIQTENRNYRPDVVANPPVKSTLNIGGTITERAALLTRTKILITNVGANPVYVDVSPGVTTASYAFILNPQETMVDTFHPGLYYFRCATGLTTTVELREWQ